MKAVYVCPFVVESLGKCSSRAARPPRILTREWEPPPPFPTTLWLDIHGTKSLAWALVLALPCPRSVCDWAPLSLSPAFPPVK